MFHWKSSLVHFTSTFSAVLLLSGALCSFTRLSFASKAQTPKGAEAVHHKYKIESPFAWTVHSHSSSPNYILVTVIDNRTGQSRKYCTSIDALEGTIVIERRLDWNKANAKAVADEILTNTTQIYRFSNPKALAYIRPRYSEELLASVRQRLNVYSNDQLYALQTDPKNAWSMKNSGTDPDALADATAHVLLERGFFALHADLTGQAIPLTQSDIEEKQKRDQDARWQFDDNQTQALAFCRSLPGYAALSDSFRIDLASTMSMNGKPTHFNCCLVRKQAATIDSATLSGPISALKTGNYWHTFLKIYGEANRVVAKQPWIDRWKRSCNGSISLSVYTYKGIVSSAQEPQVGEAWHKAGFKGEPIYELEFRQGRDPIGTVYLNVDSDHALLYNPDLDAYFPDRVDIPGYRPDPVLIPRGRTEQQRYGARFIPVQGMADYCAVVVNSNRRH